MAHTAPPTPTRRRLELAFGVLLLLVGVSVAAVAVLALNHPASRNAAATENRQSTGLATPLSSVTSAPTSSRSTPSAPATPSGSRSASGNSGSASGNSGSASAAGSGKLPLIVLNNTSTTPASVAAGRFQQAGWTVTDTSTFSGAIRSTAAYYDPNVAGAAAAAAELQHEFPAIHRVKPKFDGLPDGPIVVVLTSDYS